MATNHVLFRIGTWDQYSSLAVKDSNTLYWISDRRELRKGNDLYGTGSEATQTLAGLMSAADKQKLDSLVNGDVHVPSYTLELQSTPEAGAVATYKLKQTLDGKSTYVGDAINIPKDKVLSGGTLKYATAADYPYPGAAVGDPYLDLELNDTASTHVYIPVRGLVGATEAGKGISVIGNIVSINLDPENSHGLKVTDSGLGLALATVDSDGAMSAEDKKTLAAISADHLKRNYAIKDSTSPLPIVKYTDGEIRVMFADGTRWTTQQVGAGGDPKKYYTHFMAYAPEGAVSFRESLDSSQKAIPASISLEQLDGNAFAGMDVYGRRYSSVWLPVANHNDDGTWTYLGATSSIDHYVGWYYSVEWYDQNGVMIGAETIRINLSNAACHSNDRPYYMNEYATKKELKDVSDSLEWGTIES